MADIRLVTILPSPSVTSVSQPPQSQGVTTQGSAPSLSALSPGTVLSGFIINRDAAGNPVLRTANGDVTFASNFFLKIGSEVTIRVENTPSGTLAHILSVDGQTPEIAETLSGFSAEPEVIVSQNLTQNPATGQTATPTGTAGTAQTAAPADTVSAPHITVTGTVIAPLPGTTTSLPSGTQLTLNVTTLQVTAEPTPTPVLPAAPTPMQNAPATPATNASYTAYARASGALPAVTTPTVTLPPTTPPATEPATTPPAPVAATPLPSAPITTIPTPAPGASPAPQAPTPTPSFTPPAVPVPTQQPAAAPQQAAIPIPAPVTAQVNASPAPAIPIATVLQQMSVPTPPAPTAPPILPQPTVTSPAMPQAGQNVTALVIGNELTGEAVLHSTAGMIRLQPGTVLPVGSQVTFEVTQITPPPTPLPTAPTTTSVSPAPLTELARQWGSMQQIFTLLAGRTQTTPDDPQPTPHATLPWMPTVGAALSPNAPPSQNISAGLMMFLTALRAGNFRNWLGKDNANWLDSQGHTDLLMKAQGEFLGIARQFTEAQPSHWQPLFFPVAVEGVLQQVRMFVKRDRKEGGGAQAERKGEETRFVVEMDLTQLGEMQMDGFVRAREQHVQFDLMIRSLTPLSPEIQQNILQIYNDTGELTGYRGSLVFQAVKEFPVNPMEEIVAHTMKSVTV